MKHPKIRRWDGVESLTTLEEGEFKVPIDGCINMLLPENVEVKKYGLYRHNYKKSL